MKAWQNKFGDFKLLHGSERTVAITDSIIVTDSIITTDSIIIPGGGLHASRSCEMLLGWTFLTMIDIF